MPSVVLKIYIKPPLNVLWSWIEIMILWTRVLYTEKNISNLYCFKRFYAKRKFSVKKFFSLVTFINLQEFLPPKQHFAICPRHLPVLCTCQFSISFRSSSIHLLLGLPRGLFPSGFHSVTDLTIVFSPHNVVQATVAFVLWSSWSRMPHKPYRTVPYCTFFSGRPLPHREHIFFSKSYFQKFSVFFEFGRCSCFTVVC